MTWYALKDAMARLFPIQHDTMHVHAGLALFFLFAVLFRRRRHGAALAWLVAFGLELVNEALDARDWIGWTGHVNWPETAEDIVNTMLWPSIALLFAHWRMPAERLHPGRGRQPSKPQPSLQFISSTPSDRRSPE